MKVIASPNPTRVSAAGACFAAVPFPEALIPRGLRAWLAYLAIRRTPHDRTTRRAQTLNPVTATDAVSREVIGRLMAEPDRYQPIFAETEPSVGEMWKISPDGPQRLPCNSAREFDSPTASLRCGRRGFSFNRYMDEAVDSPRDLLIIDGKPIWSPSLINLFRCRPPYGGGRTTYMIKLGDQDGLAVNDQQVPLWGIDSLRPCKR